MIFRIGTNPKTNSMDTVEVYSVPDPSEKNPEAVLWIDNKNNVWAWAKDDSIFVRGIVFKKPNKETRCIPTPMVKYMAERAEAQALLIAWKVKYEV